MLNSSKKKKWKIALFIVLAVVILLALAFLIYTSIYYPADQTAMQVMYEATFPVEETEKYIICGESAPAVTGYVFYPGAKVDAKAYVPYMVEVAEQAGVVCIIVKPPFRLAIFGGGLAGDVINDYPHIETWLVGGHSLGGVVAASYAEENGGKVQGLVLLASYPNTDMANSGVKVLSITGSGDEVLNQESYEQAKAKLPSQTSFVTIQGGNHAQFGSYGEQRGDGKATVSPQVQRNETVDATVDFIKLLAPVGAA